jgi:cytochrome c oxidase subunit 4
MNDEQSIEKQHREATSSWAYVLVFVALLVLLGLTFGADQLRLGVWNTVIAFGIAFAKAALIVAFFMHLHGSPRLIKVAAASGLVWLSIAISLVVADDLSRGWHDPFPSVLSSTGDPQISDRSAPGPRVEPSGRLSTPATVEDVFPPD